jgi:chemotaxis protein MotB
MSGSEEGKSQELVIIRRRGNSEEGGHHGGVWKIAYADFMTAMMAFFLVMWLINSTDKKTLTQVATYFNPMRLTDKKPNVKGLHEPDGSEGQEAAAVAKGSKSKDKDGAAKGSTRREESEIGEVRPHGQAFQQGSEAREQELRAGAGGEIDLSGRRSTGRAYRDPFDHVPRAEITPSEPSSSKAERAQPSVAPLPPEEFARPPVPEALGPLPKEATQDAAQAVAKDSGKELAAEPKKEAAIEPTPNLTNDLAKDPTKEGTKDLAKESVSETKNERVKVQVESPTKDPAKEREKEAAREAAARADAAQLEMAIKKAVAEALPGLVPNIDVTVTPEGVLISLTDDYEFGMFAIASAEPRAAMVVVMDKLGRILLGRPEPLVIRGHTDRRPYRTAAYDNWRLSAARAHMAYVMLTRSGVEEKRFERIEGYADHSLRVAHDPEAAQNRRIEILLRKMTP